MHERIGETLTGNTRVVVGGGHTVARIAIRLVRLSRPQQETFNGAPTRHATTEQACGHHSRVVEYKHITGHEY